jgi:hypothetical protein
MSNSSRLACSSVAAMACAAFAGASAAEPCAHRLATAEHVVALNAITNLMGRYSELAILRGRNTLAEVFAMEMPDVSWRTPTGPRGPEGMRQRLAAETGQVVGQIHNHSMMSPVIEVAADGKTAKGLWDSFGPNVNGLAEVGGWSWAKYAVDFIKVDGQWKIWHFQLYPVFNTPYDVSITQSAWDRAHPGRPGTMPPAAAAPARAGWTGPQNVWIYDGVTPPSGPRVPEPYCSFDPKDSVTGP